MTLPLLLSALCPFIARIAGDDIVLDNVLLTCFGGPHDPEDNGETASGVSTLGPDIDGVALPLREPQSRELADSVLPLIPWHTPVEITAATPHGVKVYTPRLGLIDVGPGLQATHPEEAVHACDLTPFAAKQFAPDMADEDLPREFAIRGSVRIIGGAQHLSLLNRSVQGVKYL